MPVIRTVRQSRTWDISNIKKDILCLKNLFLLLLLLGSVLIFEESFALSPRPPPDLTKLEISNAPKLHEEFELTILLVPYYYNENFEKDSGKEKSPITFTVIIPKNFKIIDEDFSKEIDYVYAGLDDYHTFIATREVSYPYQTTVKIIPEEPGTWNILAAGDKYDTARIFLTLTENYSFISDKSNYILKMDRCDQDIQIPYVRQEYIDLDTYRVLEGIIESLKDLTSVRDIDVNSVTNTAYVLVYTWMPTGPERSTDMYVIDGHTNSIIETNPVGVGTYNVEVNEETNEIYVFNGMDRKLYVLDGKNHSIIKSMEFYNTPGRIMEFDQSTDKIYLTNSPNFLTVIDVNSFDFDIIYNCDTISSLPTNSEKGLLYLIDSAYYHQQRVAVDIYPSNYTQPWIEELGYLRTEYLLDEDIDFMMHNTSEIDLDLDSIIIKNMDTNETVFTISEFKTLLKADEDIHIAWDQLDSDGKPVTVGNYALLIRGSDCDNSAQSKENMILGTIEGWIKRFHCENSVYVAHKLFSIIDNVLLEELQSLHGNQFSYASTDDDVNSPKKQMRDGVAPKDVICREGLELILDIFRDAACVKPSTAEKLIGYGGWRGS